MGSFLRAQGAAAPQAGVQQMEQAQSSPPGSTPLGKGVSNKQAAAPGQQTK